MARKVLINEGLAKSLAVSRDNAAPMRGGGRDSAALCDWQMQISQLGILEAELVLSNYGWSVRYASGLQNFGLIASSRNKQVDGTYADALRAAREWAERDLSRRYVTTAGV